MSQPKTSQASDSSSQPVRNNQDYVDEYGGRTTFGGNSTRTLLRVRAIVAEVERTRPVGEEQP